MKTKVTRKFQEVVNRNTKGFTIIELIIVIVIVGIMAAIAMPKLGNVSSVDVYTTARQVKSDIRYTQQRAMSKFKKTTIAFDSGADTYTISTDSGGTIISNKRLPPSSGAIFNAAYSFEFDSTGAPTAGGGVWTVVISSGSDSEQVVVSNITGRATIP